ncbi:MAG TPA: VOC family protein [Acidimicrobiia bacterium]|jgi:catechol 2,3-dioxygenase-like lactoylglutathione lyase family enzyme|nr:VOC family protein [Acidimicrobiia bacterium]
MPGDDPSPQLGQVNLVTGDIDAMVAFYRRLGVRVDDDDDASSGARHVEIAMGNGFSLELDNIVSASSWNAGVRGDRAPTVVFGFSLPTSAAVDETYRDLVAAGAVGRQPPYDAFWGARFAIVRDPDGHDIGLMGPRDRS